VAAGPEAIERFRQFQPDVTLMDLKMSEMSGVDAITAIRGYCPDAHVAVLSNYKRDVQVLRAIKAGACGYLLKSTLRKELESTIRTLHSGKRWIQVEIATEIGEHAVDQPRTLCETQVRRYLRSKRQSLKELYQPR